MIPASYLFKTIYQSRFENDDAAAREAEAPPPRGGGHVRHGAHHPAVPYLAILGLFGLAR